MNEPTTAARPQPVLRDRAAMVHAPAERRPRVVVVGAGFGGLRAARALRQAPVDVVLVDRHNYHLFQPLLYQVATAGLEPEQIARPVRAILRRQSNVEFQMTEVTGLDPSGKRLVTADGPIPYDYLILAVGGETNYFGLESVPRHGFGLKDIPEAIRIRNHVLHAFERAMLEADPERRRAAMPARLRDAAAETLWRKHVEVRFGATVADYDGARVLLKSGEVIPASTLVWAAGAKAVSLTGRLGLPTAQQGRVPVAPTLEVPGHPGIYVIGDASYLEVAGAPLPMMAPVAIQMAETATENIQRRIAGEPPLAFRYRDPGSLATIGRNAAVAYIRGIAFTGFPAWVVWLVVHIIQLIGFRNKLFVLLNWAWDYFFYERAARLITSME